MANTQIRLDVIRSEMTEARFTIHRKASDITSPAAKNNVYQWQTGTYTLQPLNITPDFSETSHWEPVKYRLSDCNYNKDWFTEAPENTLMGVGPADYFIHGVVKNVNFDPTKNGRFLDTLVDTAGIFVAGQINYESEHGVGVLQSTNTQPANQGYCLRFRVDGRENFSRGAILDFSFGQFIMRLNSAGVAQVWQSTDMTNYALVYTWQWAQQDEVHGRSHRVVIFPHCRNKIEFLSSNGALTFFDAFGIHIHFGQKGTIGKGLYEIPGEIRLMDDGITPLITESMQWGLRVTKEFRPKIQISRLAFANGTNNSGNFWDTINNITSRTGVVYPPTIQINASAEFDLNGGRVQWQLWDPKAGAPYQSDGKSDTCQFGFGMQGLGDIPGPGLGSTITPEFYGYALDKPPGFFTYDRNTYTCVGTNFKLDHGKHPEEERSSISTYDVGAYTRFNERGDIPLEIFDADSGLLFFEGTAHDVEATECPNSTPNGLHIEANGMVDNMLRMHWPDAAPDFSKDPYDAELRPYLFSEVMRVCFEASGEPRENVVIEEEGLYLKNFRIWPEEENQAKGSGHKRGSSKQSVWQPASGHPVHEFLDHIIRDVIGWHFCRDRSDRKWHIFKRPDPKLAADAFKLNPKVEFYSDFNPQTDDTLPGYKHSDLKKHTKRPNCTTIICMSVLDKSAISNSTDLAQALSDASNQDTDNTVDDAFTSGAKKNYQTCSNFFGYRNPKNPNPDINNPDFLGRQRIRVHYVETAQNFDGLSWMCRRIFEDNCFGYVYRTFEADWGDPFTYNLRKWDVVLVNGILHYIDRIEPLWSDVKLRRAHYTVSKLRFETRAPR